MEVLDKLSTGIAPDYLGAHANKLDSKGRLSIPADFRKALEVETGAETVLFCFPAFKGPVIDCGGPSLLKTLIKMVSNYDHFDQSREILEIAITSRIQKLTFDDTGRVSLPKKLKEHAGLSAQAMLVGMGDRFQIWSPEAYEKTMSAADILAEEFSDVFRARSLPSVTGGGRDD